MWTVNQPKISSHVCCQCCFLSKMSCLLHFLLLQHLHVLTQVLMRHFWLCAELVKLPNMCCFCTVRACKKIAEVPPLQILSFEAFENRTDSFMHWFRKSVTEPVTSMWRLLKLCLCHHPFHACCKKHQCCCTGCIDNCRALASASFSMMWAKCWRSAPQSPQKSVWCAAAVLFFRLHLLFCNPFIDWVQHGVKEEKGNWSELKGKNTQEFLLQLTHGCLAVLSVAQGSEICRIAAKINAVHAWLAS